MSKTPDPIEVVRDKVVPAAEELVASLAERVSPLAREAVDQVTPVAHAAAERTAALVHAAAERVGPLTQHTRDAVGPYAQQAADAVSPYTDRVAPLAQQAAERVGPVAQQAAGAVAPYAALVREQGRKTGLDLAERLEPAYEAAVGALSDARDKVSERVSGVLPVVGAAATSAAASATPLVGAATDRGRALVRSVQDEPAVVAAPKKKRGGWLTTLAIVAAAAGATYVVVRRLTGDRGSQWQTARPTTPYTPPAPTTGPATTGASTVAEAGTDQQTGPSAHDAYRAADGAAQPDQPAEGGVAEASTTSLYGTGVGAGDTRATGTDEDATAVSDVVGTTDRVADGDEATPAVPGTPRRAAPESDSPSSTSTPEGSGGSVFTNVEGEGADDEPTSPYGQERLDTELETVQERVYEEPDDAVRAEQDQAAGVGPEAHPDRYRDIAGVYLGIEPPEGYAIKGNERSMKYHLPTSNSYARTLAQIWFLDEDAAQQAGFTRAEH